MNDMFDNINGFDQIQNDLEAARARLARLSLADVEEVLKALRDPHAGLRAKSIFRTLTIGR